MLRRISGQSFKPLQIHIEVALRGVRAAQGLRILFQFVANFKTDPARSLRVDHQIHTRTYAHLQGQCVPCSAFNNEAPWKAEAASLWIETLRCYAWLDAAHEREWVVDTEFPICLDGFEVQFRPKSDMEVRVRHVA